MTRPINVAIVGYGLAGRTFHAPLVQATHGLTLRSVVTSRVDQVAEDYHGLVSTTGFESVLSDPLIDLVIIATPDDLHAAQATAAIDAGKNVVIDKPFATSYDEAKAVAERAKAANLLLTVFHSRRWDSDFLTLRSLIESGRLGPMSYFESRYERYRPTVHDRWRERVGAGIWRDLGPHLVDQALVLFGRPCAIFADLAEQRTGGLSTDYFHVQLRYACLRVVLHGGSLSAHAGARFTAHGAYGTYITHGMDPQEEMLKVGMRPADPGYGVDSNPGALLVSRDDVEARSPLTTLAGDYQAFYRQLEVALCTGSAPPVTVSEALEVMELLTAAEDSNTRRLEVIL